MVIPLIIPSFIAGVLTFLAPCTLPLVPGYLGFIGGVSLDDLRDPAKAGRVRRKVFLNGLFYVVGFSAVFVLLGSLVGLGGALLAPYRTVLARVGGVFVIIFGLFMLQMAVLFYKDRVPALAGVATKLHWLSGGWMGREHRLHVGKWIKPGTPLSSIIFGAAFAVGWTPCVGPVLGAILTLAAGEATVAQGALLLFVFSMGLGLPFLVLAAGIGWFTQHMQKISQVLPIISAVGGVFLIFLGVLVVTNSLGLWIAWFFRLFQFANYEELLLEYL